MKRSTIIIVAIIAFFAILFFWFKGSYNGFVTKDEVVKKAWADVQSSYQRRADLIPNLQSIVEGAADFERGTLTEVIEARSKASSINISADQLTPENIQKFQAAQSQLSGALSRLLVTVERYPQLQATQAFRDFQVQLEGTENRINRSRDLFNEAVQGYNTSIRKFPAFLIAGATGFFPKEGFKADAGAENAPKIDFKKNKDK
jgi:LemA protein